MPPGVEEVGSRAVRDPIGAHRALRAGREHLYSLCSMRRQEVRRVKLEDVLAAMETLLGGTETCWGVRLVSGKLHAFYHPNGCDVEIDYTPGQDFFVFLKRIETELGRN